MDIFLSLEFFSSQSSSFFLSLNKSPITKKENYEIDYNFFSETAKKNATKVIEFEEGG